MNIAIDVSPLKTGNFLQHRVRGTGSYVAELKRSLLKFAPENEYVFFNKGEDLKSVDIVHIPYFEPFFFTAPIIKKNKTIITIHDLTPLVFPKNFPPGLWGTIRWNIQKKLLRKMDAIITDSECSKKDIIKYTGISPKKVFVVYLAAAEEFKKITIPEKRKSFLRKKYNLPAKFILYVGDVTWNKNLPRFLCAVEKAKKPCVLVGKAILEKEFDRSNLWNQDRIRAQEILAKSKYIQAVGFVPIDELVELYNLATVLAMPSLYEGFGLPILEAMQCGCPVIASRLGSIPEVAGDAALYVNPYDIKNISDGIKKLFFNDNLRINQISAGFVQVKKFNWKKTARETIRIYEENN